MRKNVDKRCQKNDKKDEKGPVQQRSAVRLAAVAVAIGCA